MSENEKLLKECFDDCTGRLNSFAGYEGIAYALINNGKCISTKGSIILSHFGNDLKEFVTISDSYKGVSLELIEFDIESFQTSEIFKVFLHFQWQKMNTEIAGYQLQIDIAETKKLQFEQLMTNCKIN